jgi:hypothetical protein
MTYWLTISCESVNFQAAFQLIQKLNEQNLSVWEQKKTPQDLH